MKDERFQLVYAEAVTLTNKFGTEEDKFVFGDKR